MNPWRTKLVLGSGVAAVLLYGLLFLPTLDGYGYAAHSGWANPPSFFYFGGASTHHDATVRRGSAGGPGVRGGGIHGGK